MTFVVRWGPDNAWRTSYGSEEEAKAHAEELRERWPQVTVEPGP